MRQTKVTNANRLAFYQQLYPMQSEDMSTLMDITDVSGPIITIDCCGWRYRDVFKKEIIMIETVTAAKQFALDKSKFTRLVDDRDGPGPSRWPNVDAPGCLLLLDRSPLLKYKTLKQIQDLVQNLTNHYQPNLVRLRGDLMFVDDPRLCDRFYNWTNFQIFGYTIQRFLYDTIDRCYAVDLRSKT